MKKLLIIALALCSAPAMAQWHHERYRGGVYYGGSNWLAPAFVTGIIGYEIARSQQPVIVQQGSIIVQPPVLVPAQTVCTEWKEIQSADGQIYRERNCFQR